MNRKGAARHSAARRLRIAVIGGGINGIMSAWALAKAGHEVRLLERGGLMRATSSASTKLLHGGLRYLEQGEFRLVRESLRERRWWLDQAPHLAHRMCLLLPVYRWSRRRRHTIALGLGLYGWLAGLGGLGPSTWHDRDSLGSLLPELRSDELLGGYSFWDGQMDDYSLGLWAADRARECGVVIDEHVPVESIDAGGTVWCAGTPTRFDRTVNVAGPWSAALLNSSGIPTAYSIDPIRGSHLLIDRPLSIGVLAEVPGDRRVAFVLPWQGRSLIGTTEVRQSLDEPAFCSTEERGYLLRFYNSIFKNAVDSPDIVSSFSGIRPLVKSARDPHHASREYAIETTGSITSVFGGKWTTSRALGEQVARRVLAGCQ